MRFLSNVSRKPALVKEAMDAWRTQAEMLQVPVYTQSFRKQEEKMERWRQNLHSKLPLTAEEINAILR